MQQKITHLQTRVNHWLRPIAPLIETVQLWLDVGGMRMSAAMTFYGLLSLSPLVLLIVAMLGWWMDRSTVESTLLAQVDSIMGERGASVVQAALSSAQQPSEGGLASVVALVLLMSGATGVFVELQNALDRLWEHGRPPEHLPKKPWWSVAMLRLRGLAYVLIVGFLLLVTMVMSAAIRLMMQWAGEFLNMEPPGLVVLLLNEGLMFVLSVGLFWGLMRLGAGQRPRTRFLLVGALVGATLFTLSKQAMAWYLANAAVVSAYGAAGSIVVVLMWIYVTSAILLLGASAAKALDLRAAKAEAKTEAEAQETASNSSPSRGTATASTPRTALAQPLSVPAQPVGVLWPRSPGSQTSTVWPQI